MSDTPPRKQDRILFPLSLLQDVDPVHLTKKKLTEEEAHAAFGKFIDDALGYAYGRRMYGTALEFYLAYGAIGVYRPWDLEKDCESEYRGQLEEAAARADAVQAKYMDMHGKHSATVVIWLVAFWDLYRGRMSYFTFTVIVAVLSRLGNAAKTKNGRLYHPMTYEEIKSRMLGYTQWKDPAANEAKLKAKISNARIKTVLQKYEDKFYLRFYDGRKWIYASRRNFKSKEAFREWYGTMKAKKKNVYKMSAREDARCLQEIIQREMSQEKQP